MRRAYPTPHFILNANKINNLELFLGETPETAGAFLDLVAENIATLHIDHLQGVTTTARYTGPWIFSNDRRYTGFTG